MIEKLNNFFTESLQILSENQIKEREINKITINNDFFKDEFNPNFKSGNKSQYVIEQLALISSVNGPVLYWFEFDDLKVKKSVLREKFLDYKNRLGNQYHSPEYRYTSSFKRNMDEVKNVLYVGKVEKGFIQRITTHLGYATSPRTAGMQLHHWYACDINNFGNLTLNYIEFDEKMIYLLAVLEKIIAKELKPLIGRY